MSTPQSQAEDVRSVLRNGTATTLTVSTLQNLLSTTRDASKDVATARTTKAIPAGNSSSRVARTTTNARMTKKSASTTIANDETPSLTVKARYVLATDVVNITLKALSDGLRPVLSIPKNASRISKPKKASPLAERALQPGSVNVTPTKSAGTTGTKSSGTVDSTPQTGSANLQATGECARLGFSFLRSINTSKLGVKEIPVLQLENGMLALAGKLHGHGLDSLAAKELQILKHMLEQFGRSTRATVPERQTLAGLLQLDPDLDNHPEILPIAVAYQQLVLRIIATSKRPASIEACLAHLDLELPNSPVNLILRHGDVTGDEAKTAKLLDTLSTTILALCPSTAPKADSAATDKYQSPAPETCFRLQATALLVRKTWWTFVGHQPDIEKELYEPFSRCLAAYIRRAIGSQSATDVYNTVEPLAREVIKGVDFQAHSEAMVIIHRTLCSLAEDAHLHSEAGTWAAGMSMCCATLDRSHARRIAAAVNCFCFGMGAEADRTAALEAITNGLKESMSGNSADYEYLVQRSAVLLPLLAREPGISPILPGFLKQVASFTLRFVRSYPGRALPHAQAILQSVIRQTPQSEDILQWFTLDAAKIFIDSGVLTAVSQEARSQPNKRAWSVSTATTTLARIVYLLTLQAVRSNQGHDSSAITDDENLDNFGCGLVLDLQLDCLFEQASRPKYAGTISKLLPSVLERLSDVYAVSEHPLRRAALAARVLRFSDSQPELLPRDLIETWSNIRIDEDRLAQDEGLRRFLPDVEAALNVTRIFHDGRPSVTSLIAALEVWEKLLPADAQTPSNDDYAVLDIPRWKCTLNAMAAYLAAAGEDTVCLRVLRLLFRLEETIDCKSDDARRARIRLAEHMITLGYAEQANAVLQEKSLFETWENSDTLTQMQHNLTYAQYSLATDDYNSCQFALAGAKVLRDCLPPKDVQRVDREMYERMHAEAWLARSKLSLAQGVPMEALAAGKHAVKLLNSTWHRLEKSNTVDTSVIESMSEPGDVEVGELATGVSKLKLSPIDNKKKESKPRGAIFWPLIQILCGALAHLSYLYRYQGLYSESDYYSTKAVEIAESVGSCPLISRMQSHRAMLLNKADKMEEAELSLTACEDVDISRCPLAQAERLEAQAAIRAKEGSVEEAKRLYAEALQVIDSMQSAEAIENLGLTSSSIDELTTSVGKISTDSASVRTKVSAPKARATAGARTAVAQRKTQSKIVRAGAPVKTARVTKEQSSTTSVHCLLHKHALKVQLDNHIMLAECDKTEAAVSGALEHKQNDATFRAKQQRLQYLLSMHQAGEALEADFTYNILPESTLSYPATLPATGSPDLTEKVPVPVAKAKAAPRTTAKAVERKAIVEPSFGGILQKAHASFGNTGGAADHDRALPDMHTHSAMLASTGMLLTASRYPHSLTSIDIGLSLDSSRIAAIQYDHAATSVDLSHETAKPTPFEWPTLSSTSPSPSLSTLDFQHQYIDILPAPWTAVSLSLSTDASELYIARYRSSQPAFLLRIPFSRHKPEELGEETFDYAAGKAELQDIIQLSNYSCHNTGDMAGKGAKSKWWSEREALDRRLQELLMNMEEIWFGGFRGILSPMARPEDLLGKFRNAFEGILDRHLPSRQMVKGKEKALQLDDGVLELFVNLGNDHDGAINLDEPVADLLYFVVDMLQFNGERNAYDEIDFDSMTVEVLDALRAYHEDLAADKEMEDQHLILVLDKRLQAFPWENMPCLEGVGASRVGSLQTLRECIMAMRHPVHHAVSRTKGTYILNPSADLKSTQTVLAPALTKAADASWSSFIERAPSEDEFRPALQDSSMLLYFGHGAGSQYIRPRTIKKLSRCSEVVWLMGCSSGAVTEYGELEPQAVPLTYLLSGSASETTDSKKCMAVVATLWDVTDKDIDRFSLTVGEAWGLWPAAADPVKAPAKTPKKRERLLAPTTPPQAPKTPRASRTPAPAKTPARSRSRPAVSSRAGQRSLVEAVAKSREACYLRYLNGAAAVVYGVPVYLGP